jgi:hypothetical protein
VASILPAGGAAKPLTKAKAKKLFFTEQESDARYLREGAIELISNGPWAAMTDYGTAASIDVKTYSAQLNPTTAGLNGAQMQLVSPAMLGLRTYALESVNVCYYISSGGGGADKIEFTAINQSSGGRALYDDTDRTQNVTTPECYSVAPSTPAAPAQDAALNLEIAFAADNGADLLTLVGVRTIWVRQGSP